MGIFSSWDLYSDDAKNSIIGWKNKQKQLSLFENNLIETTSAEKFHHLIIFPLFELVDCILISSQIIFKDASIFYYDNRYLMEFPKLNSVTNSLSPKTYTFLSPFLKICPLDFGWADSDN
ncbi:hypothetical protein BpHYR1_027296 [Brachionus plicatilis]|uniref:Uncharacterized protein n=1 Tax=Brachionus plicatilis TaxID=10195 RepID=A0A3M7Q2P2_BRAPC|nr:hypothetical protein BpHYR1_027296 [Brachionus plicatilis]